MSQRLNLSAERWELAPAGRARARAGISASLRALWHAKLGGSARGVPDEAAADAAAAEIEGAPRRLPSLPSPSLLPHPAPELRGGDGALPPGPPGRGGG